MSTCKGLFQRMRSAIVRGIRQVCVVTGVAFVAIAVTSLLVPLVLGIALLAMAGWATDREPPDTLVVTTAAR